MLTINTILQRIEGIFFNEKAPFLGRVGYFGKYFPVFVHLVLGDGAAVCLSSPGPLASLLPRH